ncbi:hypothetical protein SpCBS45565_g05698 [Spizellomyces sp. 'palustris']|nr:hypothetical protein SpCBS45565_g05698 [Spizellomyces sp. 'palustris']
MSIPRLLPTLLRDFDRAFSSLEEPLSQALFARPLRGAQTANLYRPAVDVSETKNAYLIEAELPGARREDIDLEFTDSNTIVVKGNIGPKETAQSYPDVFSATSEASAVTTSNADANTPTTISAEIPTYWTQERTLGSFRRSFTFPTAVDSERVRAVFRDGVLSVHVPKPEQKVNKINITAE